MNLRNLLLFATFELNFELVQFLLKLDNLFLFFFEIQGTFLRILFGQPSLICGIYEFLRYLHDLLF